MMTMNSASFVDAKIAEWKTQGLSKSDICVNIANACIGWPYVWGALGQIDSPSNRKALTERSSIPEAEAEIAIKKCQKLNGSAPDCNGCKYYPGATTRCFDCRGFTNWVLRQVGITLQGGGATSQWNSNSNWKQKGPIAEMPMDKVCCVFWYDKTKDNMNHTGLYLGNGTIVHCSGEVIVGKPTDRGWSHYGLPNGLEGGTPVPVDKPTLRKGSRGEYVTLLQTKLIQLGYDLSPYGADGSYGNKTVAAVKEFQKDRGLVADGICGPKTWTAIDGSEPTTMYSVNIPHLTCTKAQALVEQYPGATMIEEK